MEEAESKARHRILVIDDDPETARLVRSWFSGEPYDVQAADNGRDGLDAARRQVPDLILDLWILPAGRWSARAVASLRWIQQGQVHLYLLYLVGALIAMLVLWQ